MLDLHRHDSFSFFDGFGDTAHLAALAKRKGYTALGTSNHGNTSSLVEHYFSCKEEGIKPVLGCEVYFQPKFDKEKPRYHLC
jgi:DNA polymerase-3 subunit alpha